MIINDNGVNREATLKEIAEIEVAQAKISDEIAAIEALNEEKKAKREIAKTKLKALGLTADDLEALGLGGN